MGLKLSIAHIILQQIGIMNVLTHRMDWNRIQSLWGAARVGGRGQSVKLVANALVGPNPMLPT